MIWRLSRVTPRCRQVCPCRRSPKRRGASSRSCFSRRRHRAGSSAAWRRCCPMSIDLGIVESSILPLLKGLKVTAQVCVLGIPLGIVLGTIAAYFRASSWRVLRTSALVYVEIVRNVPFLILVYLSFFGLPKIG